MEAMRPSPAQAKAKVNEYIAFLEENGVPTALFKERVKDIVDWGDSVRLRKPNPAAPKSPEMKGIQSALDGMCRSEKYVREQRRGKYPHYPYASEEQKTLAETLSAIDMSQQAKEASSRHCTVAATIRLVCVWTCRTPGSYLNEVY